MIRIGPITIMRTRTRRAYKDLANAAYKLHQTIWHADDLCLPATQTEIKRLDAQLAGAISYTPPGDIE